jgi:major membrane immunogen (membrane-anchored lipoprotein)
LIVAPNLTFSSSGEGETSMMRLTIVPAAVALFVFALYARPLVYDEIREQGAVMRDGYYTAQAGSYDQEGWKDYVTIYVSGGRIVTAEFNATNSAGFTRSWDMDYQRAIRSKTGMLPSLYQRAYVNELQSLQNPKRVRPVARAEQQHAVFQALAEAAIRQAEAGDRSVALVDLPDRLGTTP